MSRSTPIPRSSMLALPFLCITILFLLSQNLTIIAWLKTNLSPDAWMASQFHHEQPIYLRSEPLNFRNLSHLLDVPTKSLPNPHIRAFRQCPVKANNVTNAIRLQRLILNISMAPPGSAVDGKQYFNPALIPLPPPSPYPYLLLSRLVTGGVHQESHVCLATLCQTRNATHTHISADSRACDTDDLEVLGPLGGLRCATQPQRLNIPPTPALKCQGAWAAFPDIPGFHDPRVFWSGMGEPLVIVNSASRYACVGLWVVDLRAVYPELEMVLGRKGGYAAVESEEGKSWKFDDGSARMRYPYLTEITRNPRRSRSAVEKNWILFFPRLDESWVQYDLVAHGGREKKEEPVEHYTETGLKTTAPEKKNNSSAGIGHELDNSPTIASDNAYEISELGWNASKFAKNINHNMNISSTALTPVRRSKHSQHPPAPYHQPRLTPSRSLAKIIGSGYTTSNLTSADEAPCLTSDDILDTRSNQGHWHQGSNSLRLILCSRQDLECLRDHNEEDLIRDGKIVHFAILHRKFSNDLDLPMRYERYIMVWEARYPFRMLGISRYPILFAGERAQPWSIVENRLKDEIQAKRWGGVYFMYTPSLTWSWRRQNLISDNGGVSEGPGTGYLGDEVMVGIGMDDVAQGFVKVKVDELLSCLRMCPDFADV